jgi:hypothetical protein
MNKKAFLIFLLAFGAANAQQTTMQHKSGGKTQVKTDSTGTQVKSTSKSTGNERNVESHQANVNRVKKEGRDRGDPVVKQSGKAVKQ